MDNSVGGRRPCLPFCITLGINNFHYNSSIKDFAFSRSAMKRWWFFDLICRLNFSDRTVLSLRWVFKLMLTKFYFQPIRNWALNLKTGLLCITLKIIWHSSQNKAPKQNLILTSGRKSRTWTQRQTYVRDHARSLCPTRTRTKSWRQIRVPTWTKFEFQTPTRTRPCVPTHLWPLLSKIPTKTSSTVFFIIKLSRICT